MTTSARNQLKQSNYLINDELEQLSFFEHSYKSYKPFSRLTKKIGFDNTANIYSISDSSKFGGKIGWIDEENLAPIIKSEILKINKDDYTKPIIINNNFLILKLQNTKKEEIKMNKDLLLNKMMQYEINTQLSKYSKIYYNKIKINTEIYEF